jgi:hypothetical protein
MELVNIIPTFYQAWDKLYQLPQKWLAQKTGQNGDEIKIKRKETCGKATTLDGPSEDKC